MKYAKGNQTQKVKRTWICDIDEAARVLLKTPTGKGRQQPVEGLVAAKRVLSRRGSDACDTKLTTLGRRHSLTLTKWHQSIAD